MTVRARNAAAAVAVGCVFGWLLTVAGLYVALCCFDTGDLIVANPLN